MFDVYVGKVVKVDISNGYFYHGKIIEVTDTFLSMIDRNGKAVTIAISDILNIREMGQ